MSGENWVECPMCNLKRMAAKEALREQYGKIPLEDYKKLEDESRRGDPGDCTLREDSKVGIESDGMFRIKYEGSCALCGFAFSHTFKEIVCRLVKPPSGTM